MSLYAAGRLKNQLITSPVLDRFHDSSKVNALCYMLRKYAKQWKSMSKCVKVLENVLKVKKVYQSVQKKRKFVIKHAEARGSVGIGNCLNVKGNLSNLFSLAVQKSVACLRGEGCA